jgi:hypothetical protein
MPDNQYEILIKTISDNTGIVQAAKNLENLTAKTGGASVAAGKHNMHMHEMHRVIHALNGVIPGLGVLFQAAFSPIGATITLAVLALHAFKEKMKEWNAEMDKASEEYAKPLTHRVEAMREGFVKTGSALAEFYDKLAQAAKGEQSLKEQTEKAIAASKEQANIAATLQDALKGVELEGLERFHKAGLISAERYAEMKLQIELKFEQAKRQSQLDQERFEIDLQQRAIDRAKKELPELAKKAQKAIEEAGAKEADFKAMPTEEEVKQRREKAKEALKGFEAKWDPNMLKQFGVGGEHPIPEYTKLYEQYLELQKAVDRSEKEFAARPRESTRREVAAMLAKAEAERAGKRTDEAESYVTETERSLGVRRDQFKYRGAVNNALNAAGTFKSGVGQTAMERMSSAMDTAEAIGRHQNVSDASKSNMMETASMIMGRTANQSQAMGIFSMAAQRLDILNKNTERIMQVINAVINRQEAHSNAIRQTQNRLNHSNSVP